MQRSFAYSLKIGSSRVLITSVKLAVVVVPIAEIFAGFISTERKLSLRDILAEGFSSFIWQQIVFVFGAICATVCWELCHHLVQVYIFSLALNSLYVQWPPYLLRVLLHSDYNMSTILKM